MAIKKFSDNNLTFDELDAWFNAAIKDGWKATEVYPGHETVDTAAYLEKDGFKVMLMRRKVLWGNKQTHGDINIWGPDGLFIPPIPAYDLEKLKKGLFFCQGCGYHAFPTSRVNFAGRACEKCQKDPEFMKKAEPRGWED